MTLGNPRSFEFVESPPMDAINKAIQDLIRIGALDREEGILPLGEILSKLPVEISIGKILVLGSIFKLVNPLLTICATMSVQSPFVRNCSDEASNFRKEYMSDEGDPFTMLSFYDAWIDIKTNTRDSSKKWCRRHGLEEQRMYEISKLRNQFEELLRDSKLLERSKEKEPLSAFEILEGKREKKAGKSSTNLFGDKIGSKDAEKKKREIRMLQMERDKKRRKRILTFQDEDSHGKDDEEEEIDLRDIEFKISNSAEFLGKTVGKSLAKREINILKLILFSGLYPNVAIGDEFNSSHKESDQVYHSPFKNILSIHPTSIFNGASHLVTRTDLLCYSKLLETNKPYITNAFRISAIHPLLLFARTLDTNKTGDKIVVDNWLMIKIDQVKAAEKILIIISQIRNLISHFLLRKLVVESQRFSHGNSEKTDYAEKLAGKLHEFPAFIQQICEVHDYSELSEDILSEKMSEFLECSIGYQIFMLKKSQILTMFKKKESGEEPKQELNPMEQLEVMAMANTDDFDQDKVGTQINDYLRFGSVLEEDEMDQSAAFTSYMKKSYHCEKCQRDFMFNLEELKKHQDEHSEKKSKE
eukprot:TRINITY_DN3747_c0_g1_i2.p1 TRINITY_DN3747_c0_g1~~TRINITY_DN3747_c0_g1_i2.p1  ORF type:complete len:586 (+),score=198.21 TRINITY_DN3747_c0_g1_i2:1720-3477(+)